MKNNCKAILLSFNLKRCLHWIEKRLSLYEVVMKKKQSFALETFLPFSFMANEVIFSH